MKSFRRRNPFFPFSKISLSVSTAHFMDIKAIHVRYPSTALYKKLRQLPFAFLPHLEATRQGQAGSEVPSFENKRSSVAQDPTTYGHFFPFPLHPLGDKKPNRADLGEAWKECHWLARPFAYLQLHRVNDTVHIENVQSVEKERRLLLPRCGARRCTPEELPEGGREVLERRPWREGGELTKQNKKKPQKTPRTGSGDRRSAQLVPPPFRRQTPRGRTEDHAQEEGTTERREGRMSKSDVSGDEAARAFFFLPLPSFLLLQRERLRKTATHPLHTTATRLLRLLRRGGWLKDVAVDAPPPRRVLFFFTVTLRQQTETIG